MEGVVADSASDACVDERDSGRKGISVGERGNQYRDPDRWLVADGMHG